MIDFLIVGLGLSGAAFSWELEKRNLSYRIVDPCTGDSATYISGGLINPVSGRKYNLQWNITALTEKITKEFSALEKKLGQQFLFHHNILKIHKSEAAQEEWLTKKDNPEIQPYIDRSFLPDEFSQTLNISNGSILVKNAYHIDTAGFMQHYTAYLEQKETLCKDLFHYTDLMLHDDHVTWKNNHYRFIVFCEGIHAMQNPYFHWVPFVPSKGECMLVKIPGFTTDLIIQKNIHLIPVGKQTYWAGSTNSWDDLLPQPTVAAHDEVIAALNDLLQIPYHILSHKAGIRPSIRDRAPVVGAHPEVKHMYILNGMGTKGASLSNYYAEELAEYILSRKPIASEAGINRFLPYFTS